MHRCCKEIFEQVNLSNCCLIHEQVRDNLANENILVARRKESKNDSCSSGEQNGSSLNSQNGDVGEQHPINNEFRYLLLEV